MTEKNDLMERIKKACAVDTLQQLTELYAAVISARTAPVDKEAADMLDEALRIIGHAMADRVTGARPIEHRTSRTALFQGITTLWENAFLYGDDPVYVANELKKEGLENLAPWGQMDDTDREIYKEYFDFLTGSWAKTHGENIKPDITSWKQELIKQSRIDEE